MRIQQENLQFQRDAGLRPVRNAARRISTLFYWIAGIFFAYIFFVGYEAELDRVSKSPVDFQVPGRKTESRPPILQELGATNAVAVSLGFAPGALVCPDLQIAGMIFRQYTAHWEASLQDRILGAQATLIRGPTPPPPVPELFGCVLLDPGTRVVLDRQKTLVPYITARLPNGQLFSGVTMHGMVRLIEK